MFLTNTERAYSIIRCLASLRRVRQGAVPRGSSVLSRHYDFLSPVSRHFVSFVRRYHGCTRAFALARSSAARASLELVTRYLRPGCFRGNDRTSQVPGQPQYVRLHMLPRLRRDGRSRPARRLPRRIFFQSNRMAPADRKDKGSRKEILSKLNHMAFGLAVYASSRRVTLRNARLASGRRSNATGRASHPQGHNQRFQIHIMSIILLRQASWRNLPIAPGITLMEGFL